MIFMENINKLQAVVTELRREAQRSEAPKAGKLPCRHSLWTCPICHAEEYAKYMVTGCICYPKIPGSHKNCPVHGKDTWAGGSRPTDRPTKEHILTPDLPLHVRVAREVGWRHCCLDRGIDEWMGYASNLLQTWSNIPDYPNDLVAILEAVPVYLKIANKKRPVASMEYQMDMLVHSDDSGHVRIYNDIPPATVVNFGEGREHYEANNMLWAKTKAEALSLLIVAHAEKK